MFKLHVTLQQRHTTFLPHSCQRGKRVALVSGTLGNTVQWGVRGFALNTPDSNPCSSPCSCENMGKLRTLGLDLPSREVGIGQLLRPGMGREARDVPGCASMLRPFSPHVTVSESCLLQLNCQKHIERRGTRGATGASLGIRLWHR